MSARVTKVRRALRNVVVASVAALACGALAGVPVATSATALTYVALGDSYASGEGLAPFVATTPTSCDRSVQSYPYLVATSLGVDPAGANFHDVTCAGALLSNLATSVDGAPAQALAVRTGTDLVTLNAGGNDTNFAKLAATCLNVRAFASFAHVEQQLCAATIAASERFLGVTKRTKPLYASVLHAHFSSSLVSTLVKVVASLRAAQGLVDASSGRSTVLAVVNYPVLFPLERMNAPACQVGIGLSYATRDVVTLRAINVLLDQEILHGVALYARHHGDANVLGVNVARALHPLSCRVAPGASDVRAIDLAHPGYSLHPLASGQVKIARALEATLAAHALT